MFQSRSFVSITALSALLFCGCASGSRPAADAAPAPAQRPAWPHGAMVSAANPYAVAAAETVLAAGGHAVDAAIAAHAVLGLVEPQSSGLGGGGFMVVYDHASDLVVVYDGRETAPAGVTPELFLEDGEPMGFLTAWQSGRAVGVPGVVAMYEVAHAAHGRQSWSGLFAEAIRLADDGFRVSPRLNDLLTRITRVSLLDDHPESAAYFYPDGEPLPVGYLRRNPDYADTLRRIAAEGSAAMYRGPLAEAIAAAARGEPHGGSLSVADLAAYEVQVREPVCGAFRAYRICSAPPPSSGMAQIAMAGLYDRLVTPQTEANDAVRLAAFVDAQRLAYADRDHYVADPAFVAVPVDDLLHPDYLAARAHDRFAPGESPHHGDPGLVLRGKPLAAQLGPDRTRETPGTTHLSVIDLDGNAVSLTASIEAPFGTSRFVGGFLLNNELTDFSRDPRPDGRLAANAPAPGKRPRSSMSPTLVFDSDGELLLVTGSPGGNSIPAYVAKSILGSLAWDLDVQESVDAPNVVARGERVRVEVGSARGARIAATLAAAGYPVQEREGENSGLHVIRVTPSGLVGAADPRREGAVSAVGRDD